MTYDYEANKAKLCGPNGVRLTSGLFQELSDNPLAPFKLSDWKRRYVEIADPSDYDAAMELIGDWDHWQLLLENRPVAEHINKWRLEVEVKLRSRGIKDMTKHAKQPGGAAAAKWLAEAGFAMRDKRKPKDKEQDDAAAKEAKASVAADAKRLGLTVVK